MCVFIYLCNRMVLLSGLLNTLTNFSVLDPVRSALKPFYNTVVSLKCRCLAVVSGALLPWIICTAFEL